MKRKNNKNLGLNEGNALIQEGEIIYQTHMFNLYIQAIVGERYDGCMDYLKEFKEEHDDIENPFATLVYDFDFEEEWIDYVMNVAEWTREQALTVYNSEYGLDIYNEDDVCQYVYDNFKNVDDICSDACLVYLETPDYNDYVE